MPPLTRHLYREDEVLSSIKWCCLRGRYTELAFWVQEALDSAMAAQCLECLLWCWCFGCGPTAFGWIERFKGIGVNSAETGIDAEEVLCAALSLSLHCRRSADSSVVAMLGAGLLDAAHFRDVNEILGTHSTPVNPTLTEEEGAILRAIQQKKKVFAWRLARHQWSPPLWSVLQEKTGFPFQTEEAVNEWLSIFTDPTLWTWPLRAVLIAAAATTDRVLSSAEVASPMPEVLEERAKWFSLSMRARRIYSPLYDSLPWLTERGYQRMNTNTLGELQEGLEDALLQSQFWEEPLMEARTDDRKREVFYDTFFPNDIPDEWSKADRERSHGAGAFPTHKDVNRPVLFQTNLNRWFGKIPARGIWKGMEVAVRECVRRWGEDWPASFEEGIKNTYTEDLIEASRTIIQTISLEPRKREFIVL